MVRLSVCVIEVGVFYVLFVLCVGSMMGLFVVGVYDFVLCVYF